MFPSIITTFVKVNPTDRLNSPSHSALHNTVSSALGQVQAVIGIDGSGVGTIIGDLRNPASDGGGHIQTAVKGGTGQTTFAKGDLLVATAPTVVSKLAVSSTTGEFLQTDASQATGMKWGGSGFKLSIANASTVAGNAGETVVFAASIIGSTLGINNAVRFTGYMPVMRSGSGTGEDGLTFNIKYGVNTFGTITMSSSSGPSNPQKGIIEGIIANNNVVNSQFGYVRIYGSGNVLSGGADASFSSVFTGFSNGSASINSSATQNLIITTQYLNNVNSIQGGLFLLEKIS
jgi:hypothetical protein